jgi:hypothetical protein
MVKTTLISVLVSLLYFGGLGMGNPLEESAKRKLAPFKQQIGYDKIVASLGPEKKYIVDWEVLLSEFVDANGVKWTLDPDPSYYIIGRSGNARFEMSSDQGAARLELYTAGGGQRGAIDTVLGIVSNTPAPEILMKFSTTLCPGDFCLVSSDDEEMDRLYMVKGNVVMRLMGIDDCPVLPVGKYIADTMEKRKTDPHRSPLDTVQLQLKVDRNNVKRGDEFVFSVEPRTLFSDDAWLIEVNATNDDELEFVSEEPGRYTYKALKIGAAKITVAVMHKRTLQVKEETFVVNVN